MVAQPAHEQFIEDHELSGAESTMCLDGTAKVLQFPGAQEDKMPEIDVTKPGMAFQAAVNENFRRSARDKFPAANW